MSINEIHMNDVGTQFILTVKDENNDIVDLSTASTKQVLFKKPDETILTKTGSLYTDGTDGIVSYIGESGVLDQKGTWKLQAKVIIGSTVFNSDVTRFKVYGNIEGG